MKYNVRFSEDKWSALTVSETKERSCWVTNPGRPNDSGHARGRKIHLTRDGKKSICNMQLDHYADAYTTITRMCMGKLCMVCFKKYETK